MLALVCTTTYSISTELGSCCGMQLCIANITTLHCVPELQLKPYVYPERQNHGQHSLPRSLCHDILYRFCAFCHLNVSISQVHLDLGVSISEKLHNCAQPAHYNQSTSSSGDATCSDSHCPWQRSWMVHEQCQLHEQHSHSRSGTDSWQPAWGAGWPNQDLSKIIYTQVSMCWNTFWKLAVHCTFTEQYLWWIYRQVQRNSWHIP